MCIWEGGRVWEEGCVVGKAGVCWGRRASLGGRECVCEGGHVLEKAGVFGEGAAFGRKGTDRPVEGVELHGQDGLGLGLDGRVGVGEGLRPGLRRLHGRGHQALEDLPDVDALVALGDAGDGGGGLEHVGAGRLGAALLGLDLGGQGAEQLAHGVGAPGAGLQVGPVQHARHLLLPDARVRVRERAFHLQLLPRRGRVLTALREARGVLCGRRPP